MEWVGSNERFADDSDDSGGDVPSSGPVATAPIPSIEDLRSALNDWLDNIDQVWDSACAEAGISDTGVPETGGQVEMLLTVLLNTSPSCRVPVTSWRIRRAAATRLASVGRTIPSCQKSFTPTTERSRP